MSAARIACCAGAFSLALILIVLGFQYLGGYLPCEMCQWQRWPHIAAAFIGLVGGTMLMRGGIDARYGTAIAALALLLIAVSGVIGVDQAGVEWHWWEGPQACTGARFVLGGAQALQSAGHVVRCDEAAWRLLGISLAGYNGVVSLGFAALGSALLLRKDR